MTPASNRSEPRAARTARAAAFAALGALLGACSAGPPNFATHSAPSDEPRRPPAVAVDPRPLLPTASATVDSSEGLATLVAPASTATARQLTRRFFESVLQGDAVSLNAMIDEQAWFTGGAGAGRQRARAFWQSRLARIDYTTLALPAVYRDSDVHVYRGEDVATLRPARQLPAFAQGDDLVVRVPITSTRVGRSRVFGDEMVFVLRPKGASFTIVELVEDFQLQ